MSDERFDDGSDLLLLTTGEARGGFEKLLHLAGRTRAALADEMAEDTYNQLDAAAEVMEGKGTLSGRLPAIPWNRISGIVHEFNAASTESEKQYQLTILESTVRRWQIEQQKKRERERQLEEMSRRKSE